MQIFVPDNNKFNGCLISWSILSFFYSFFLIILLVNLLIFSSFLFFILNNSGGILVLLFFSSFSKDSYPGNNMLLQMGHLFLEFLKISDTHLSCNIWPHVNFIEVNSSFDYSQKEQISTVFNFKLFFIFFKHSVKYIYIGILFIMLLLSCSISWSKILSNS